MRIANCVAPMALALGLSFSGAAVAADTVAASSRTIHIPAQTLSSALQAVAQEGAFQLICRADLVEGLTTPDVSGKFTPEQVLEKLLGGTGLTYRYLDERTVMIVKESLALARTEDTEAGEPVNDNDGRSSSNMDSSDRNKVEEIVVTAQKREERLTDVPISISVLDGEALDRSTFTSMNDALRSVPGLVLFEQGQTGMTRLNMRGVSSNPSFLNSSSPVGYYLDEIPFAFVRYPSVPNTGAYDIERVEVLRGPQGTLYGAGSLNGVVRVLTQDANLNEAEFKARTTVSSTRDGGDSYRGDAALSVPIVPGKLAVRGVVGYADNAGWIDQPLTGREDINSEVQKNARLKVNAAPVENLGVEFLTWFFRDDRDGSSSSRDDRTSPTGIPESLKTEYDAYGLTLTYDFPSVSILSATNYIELSSATILNSPIGSTAPLDQIVTRIGGKLTSQEFRLSSTMSGPWRWTAGGIYRDEKDSHYFDFRSPSIDNSFPSLSGIVNNIYASRSFAVFGELTRAFFDDEWELTGGLRYFEDKTSSNELSGINPAVAPFGFREDRYDAVTPRIVLTYKPSDARNYYASYGQGFRSGFAQAGAVLALTQGAARVVRPDKLSNYEIGTKGSAFDERMSYELSAYYIDWKDTIQVVTAVIGPAAVNTALNTEGVDGPGVDAAINIKLTDRLDVGVTVSWNDLGFVRDVRSGAGILYPKDGRTPSSSETTAGVDLGYEIPLPGQYSGRLSGSVNYLSKMLTAAATTAAAQVGDNLTIARSSFTLQAPAGWSAMLFVDNLTDEDGRLTPAPPADPLAGAEHLRPRTYGLQLDYRFN